MLTAKFNQPLLISQWLTLSDHSTGTSTVHLVQSLTHNPHPTPFNKIIIHTVHIWLLRISLTHFKCLINMMNAFSHRISYLSGGQYLTSPPLFLLPASLCHLIYYFICMSTAWPASLDLAYVGTIPTNSHPLPSPSLPHTCPKPLMG